MEIINNVQEQRVGIDNARLLKQKRFNVPCQFLYVDKEYRIKNEKVGEVFDNRIPSTQIPNDWVLTPTQQVALGWTQLI